MDWAGRTKSRYHALQVALNRPFRNGLLLKGAYTLSKAKNETDDDGWAGLTWNYPAKLADNFALAGFDRTHVFQMGFVYELPFGEGVDRTPWPRSSRTGRSTASSARTRATTTRSAARTPRSTARAAARSSST